MLSVTSFKATGCMCLGVICPLHFWQNDQDLLHAIVAIRAGMDTKIRVNTQSWPWRRKFSSCSCQDSSLQPFDQEASTLTTELSQLPVHTCMVSAVVKSLIHNKLLVLGKASYMTPTIQNLHAIVRNAAVAPWTGSICLLREAAVSNQKVYPKGRTNLK